MLHLKNVHIKNEGGVMTMKRILLVCGSGICTSTAVNQKVTKALEEKRTERTVPDYTGKGFRSG